MEVRRLILTNISQHIPGGHSTYQSFLLRTAPGPARRSPPRPGRPPARVRRSLPPLAPTAPGCPAPRSAPTCRPAPRTFPLDHLDHAPHIPCKPSDAAGPHRSTCRIETSTGSSSYPAIADDTMRGADARVHRISSARQPEQPQPAGRPRSGSAPAARSARPSPGSRWPEPPRARRSRPAPRGAERRGAERGQEPKNRNRLVNPLILSFLDGAINADPGSIRPSPVR